MSIFFLSFHLKILNAHIQLVLYPIYVYLYKSITFINLFNWYCYFKNCSLGFCGQLSLISNFTALQPDTMVYQISVLYTLIYILLFFSMVIFHKCSTDAWEGVFFVIEKNFFYTASELEKCEKGVHLGMAEMRNWLYTGEKHRNSANSIRFHFGGLQNHCRWWLQPWN